MKDPFSEYHPVVNFVYFGAVLLFSMCFIHPLCVGISFFGGAAYQRRLYAGESRGKSFRFFLPILVLAFLGNALFQHRGVTRLFLLPTGNYITLESVLYGLAAAFLLAAVFFWFTCFGKVVGCDKFIYLFGRLIPSMSLVLSMIFRFVPKFRLQYREVAAAQKGIGKVGKGSSFLTNVKNNVRILSIMITWSMENGVETADSMKKRGYGLPGRTAFSLYRFQKRDGVALAAILLLAFYVLAGSLLGAVNFWYYPAPGGRMEGIFSASVFLSYFCLCYFPVFLHWREERKWKSFLLKK